MSFCEYVYFTISRLRFVNLVIMDKSTSDSRHKLAVRDVPTYPR